MLGFERRCTYRGRLLHEVINIFLCLFVLGVLSIILLIFVIHLLHTLGHLFVVAAAGEAVLRRRDCLTKLLILELHSLYTADNKHETRQLQMKLCAISGIDHTCAPLVWLQKGLLTSSRAVK